MTGDVGAVERAAARARAKLKTEELNLIFACERLLDVVRVGGPPAVMELAESLRKLLGTDHFGSYSPQRKRGGWTIDVDLHGFGSFDVAGAMEQVMNRLPENWQPGFDPDRPEPGQRNRVVQPFRHVAVEHAARSPLFQASHIHTGTLYYDQLRVLLCDGPALLAWVGGFREERFTAREARRLTALVPALLRRFRVDRRLREAGLQRAGLAAALEALGSPAFVVGPNGAVQHANANGRDAYDRDPSLRLAFARGVPAGFEATEIAVHGEPAASLFIKSAAHAELDARVAAAARAWGLTPRQAQVLALVARGDGNKLIAAKLACSLRTIELHVTAILRNAGCDSRAEVVARVGREP